MNQAVFGRYRQIATIRAADVGTHGQARDTVIARDGASRRAVHRAERAGHRPEYIPPSARCPAAYL